MPLPPAPTAPIKPVTKLRGIVLVVLGPLIFIVMGWVLVAMLPALMNPELTPRGTHDIVGVGMLASIAISGAVFFVAGVHLLRTGVIPLGIKRLGIAIVVVIVACVAIYTRT